MNLSFLVCLVVSAGAGTVAAQSADASRGQLLYATHCLECHTTRMHWRDQRQVRDWNSLTVQVRRWQAQARLEWSEEDIDAVAQHLNDTIYRLPRPAQVGRAAMP